MDIALTAFATLFVIIDPVGLAPLFIALTQDMSPATRRKIALRACIVGFCVLALFGLAGEALLGLIGIGMPAFRISGGILLLLIAIEMLFEKRTERRERQADTAEAVVHHNDPTVFPLATPLIAGPGALATMILLVGQNRGDLAAQATIFGVMALVILATYILFRLGDLMGRVLGKTGINMITRLLGMLLAALAVQFVINGLTDLGVLGT